MLSVSMANGAVERSCDGEVGRAWAILSDMKSRSGISCWIILLALQFATPCTAANPIYQALVEKGLALSPQETVKLPPPVLTDGMTSAQQKAAIETLLAGKYEWGTFARKALVAPFLLRINDEGREAGQVGRRVDLYFITYGSLDSMRGDDFLKGQLNFAAADDESADGSRVKILTADELSKRGLAVDQRAGSSRWIAVESTLLNKVRLRLTTQNLKSESADSILIASVVDPKFVNDPEYPNDWRPIAADESGRRQIGAPQPYAGLASYVKGTQLSDPAGAVFIEYHVAFAEPQGWFHGTNLLRSKLPLVVQNMVRKLRRSTER
jgi:hypothetical protein